MLLKATRLLPGVSPVGAKVEHTRLRFPSTHLYAYTTCLAFLQKEEKPICSDFFQWHCNGLFTKETFSTSFMKAKIFAFSAVYPRYQKQYLPQTGHKEYLTNKGELARYSAMKVYLYSDQIKLVICIPVSQTESLIQDFNINLKHVYDCHISWPGLCTAFELLTLAPQFSHDNSKMLVGFEGALRIESHAELAALKQFPGKEYSVSPYESTESSFKC